MGARDFDFLLGRWDVTNRRLKRLFAGSEDWDEFPASSDCRSLLEGTANMDEIDAPARGLHGMTLRLFDPERQEWSLYWANSRTGVLFPPVVGGFSEGRGDFYGDDTHEGRPIRVHYIWSMITPTSARWEQAFSADSGQSWETNWIMEFGRR
jgi:hypothetical protein